MQATLTTVRSGVRVRANRKRIGILAALLLTTVLFGSVRANADGGAGHEIVYLGSAGSGYVNVTSYLQPDIYGNIWVVGYDSEPSFEIVVDAATGQVLDPYGNQIGICTGS